MCARKFSTRLLGYQGGYFVSEYVSQSLSCYDNIVCVSVCVCVCARKFSTRLLGYQGGYFVSDMCRRACLVMIILCVRERECVCVCVCVVIIVCVCVCVHGSSVLGCRDTKVGILYLIFVTKLVLL